MHLLQHIFVLLSMIERYYITCECKDCGDDSGGYDIMMVWIEVVVVVVVLVVIILCGLITKA